MGLCTDPDSLGGRRKSKNLLMFRASALVPGSNLGLDRTEVFGSELKFRVRAGRKRYLDVWPVNLVSPADTDVADNTSLFMFQLACIVNMVPKWRNHRLRVFMCAR